MTSNTFILKCFLEFACTNLDGSQKEGVIKFASERGGSLRNGCVWGGGGGSTLEETVVFKEDISNILYNYHVNKEKEDGKYDNFFKAKIKDELEKIISKNVHDESYVFFDETHVKAAIRVPIKIVSLVLIE